ncbi:1654_t:CDS:1, partial [Entrophospora sp. SA101]
MLYFPKSGDLQVFGVIDEDYRSGEIAVQTFNNHLKEFIDLPSLGPA